MADDDEPCPCCTNGCTQPTRDLCDACYARIVQLKECPHDG